MGAMNSGPPFILDRPIAMSAKHAKSYMGMLLTESEARGAAANFYTGGADSISFWNVGIHFGSLATATSSQIERMQRWTSAFANQKAVSSGPRTYRYLPMGKGMSDRAPPLRNYPWYDEGYSPLGHKNSPTIHLGKASVGQRHAFPFLMADGRHGEKLDGKLTFWVYLLESPTQLRIDINGVQIPPGKVEAVKSGMRRGGIKGFRFEVALSNCPSFKGDNELGLTLKWLTNPDTTLYGRTEIVVVDD